MRGRTFAVLGVAGGGDGCGVREAELALLELCEDAGARGGLRGCLFCVCVFLERGEAGFLALDVLFLRDWGRGRGRDQHEDRISNIEYRGRWGGRGARRSV